MIKNKIIKPILFLAAVLTLSFSTLPVHALGITPTPVLVYPASNSTVNNIYVRFLIPVSALSNSIQLQFIGGSTISMTLSNTLPINKLDSFNISPSNVLQNNSSNITSTTSNTIPNGSYTVVLSYQDSSGDPAATATATNVTVNTSDTTAPVLSSLSPQDNQTGVATSSNLSLVFNQAVVVYSGNITVKQASNSAVVDTIPVTSSQVTGDGTNTITAALSSNLEAGTAYYIIVDPGAFQNLAGNAYAGLSSSSLWTFTTLTPAVAAASPASPDTGFGVPSGSSPLAKFGMYFAASIGLLAVSVVLRKLVSTTPGKR